MTESDIIPVLGQIYRLERRPASEMGDNMGLCCFETHTISIDETLQGDEYTTTLIHEIGHAVVHESSLNLVLSETIEEVFVDLVGKVLSRSYRLEKK